jgi:hypothetical protein
MKQGGGPQWENSQCSPPIEKTFGEEPSKDPIFDLMKFWEDWVVEMV